MLSAKTNAYNSRFQVLIRLRRMWYRRVDQLCARGTTAESAICHNVTEESHSVNLPRSCKKPNSHGADAFLTRPHIHAGWTYQQLYVVRVGQVIRFN